MSSQYFRHFSIAFSACSLLLIGSVASAAVLNVDQNDGGCNDGAGTPYCTIGAAVAAAAIAGDTVSVAPGTYVENVLISSKDLALVSTGGRAVTTIQGISFVGALGAVQIQGVTTGVDIGGPGAGFRIEGIDNGFPGVENAAIYVRGNHSNARIRDNEVVAIGEAGLLSEFGATINGFLVDNNIFSGQTFFGPVPAGCGFGSQFTTPNVPRQLVTMGGGSGGGNTSNTAFTNNMITGAAGGGLGGACTPPLEQGNTLVTIDSNGATISGNTFAGTTGRFATSLRARGPSTTIGGNTFAGAGLRPVACHVFIQNTGNNLGTVATANTFDTPLLFFPDDASAVVGTICPAPDADGDGVADDDDNCPDTPAGTQVGADGCPLPDHYLCYDAKTASGTPDFDSILVDLTDQFGTFIDVEVKKPTAFCNPVDKNGEGIKDETAHLTCYDIKQASGSPKLPKTVVQTEDQFGVLTLKRGSKAKTLCVPTEKGGVASSLQVEHYQWYKAKEESGTPDFEPVLVDLEDQFGTFLDVEVKKPTHLGTPTDKNGEGIINPESHLTCYDVKQASGTAKLPKYVIEILNQFGDLTLKLGSKPKTLCLPATKEVVSME